jgi:threonine dehydrogenase-like Zn-dependent dehydrogenase
MLFVCNGFFLISGNIKYTTTINSLTVMQCLDKLITSTTTTSTGNTHSINTTERKKKSILIIGGSGGTGHVAIQMCRYYWTNYIDHIVSISSKRNINFCSHQGASEVIAYDDDNDIVVNSDGGSATTTTTTASSRLVSKLQQSAGVPFDIVFDCVTSDDPRDFCKVHYPTIMQHKDNKLVHHLQYYYRRLGGPTSDWIRAGIERIVPSIIPLSFIWSTQYEKLFWIQFPQSSLMLQHISNGVENKLIQPPFIQNTNIYPFTKQGVENALTAINSRRVQGKVVIQLRVDTTINCNNITTK